MKIFMLLSLLFYYGFSTAIYPASFTVVGIEPETKAIVVEAENGNVYAFCDMANWSYGDHLAAIMVDPGTPDDVTDDLILEVRYTG